MEQLVLLLIIGLISLINWLMQRSARMREQRRLERAERRGEAVGEQMEDVQSRSSDSSEEDPEEAMRKLMEALGMPVEHREPPRPQETARAEQPPAPPPIPSGQRPFNEPLLYVESEKPAPPVFVRPQAGPPVRPSLTKTRSEAAVVTSTKPTRFRELLSDQHGLRDAVVLAEILGAPRGLR